MGLWVSAHSLDARCLGLVDWSWGRGCPAELRLPVPSPSPAPEPLGGCMCSCVSACAHASARGRGRVCVCGRPANGSRAPGAVVALVRLASPVCGRPMRAAETRHAGERETNDERSAEGPRVKLQGRRVVGGALTRALSTRIPRRNQQWHKQRNPGGATPRFWTPTTPPTNCWPEAPWGGV